MILYRDQKKIGPMNVYHLDNTLIMINKLTTGTEIMSRDLLSTYTTYTLVLIMHYLYFSSEYLNL